MDFYENAKTINGLLEYQLNLLKAILSEVGNTEDNMARLVKVQNKIEELFEIK